MKTAHFEFSMIIDTCTRPSILSLAAGEQARMRVSVRSKARVSRQLIAQERRFNTILQRELEKPDLHQNGDNNDDDDISICSDLQIR